jgi:hypothetical protein
MKLALPLVLGLAGGGVGIGAATLFPAPEPEETAETCGPAMPKDEGAAPDHAATTGSAVESGREYAKLNNQFIVPVVTDGEVAALVVLSLSVEVAAGEKETVFVHEPRLRDAFLQVLFDHANTGGFDGAFTSSPNMRILREELRREATATLGELASDVLIVDIVRQDL